MIKIVLPGTTKPYTPPANTSVYYPSQINNGGTMLSEAYSRDNMIKAQLKGIDYMEGDTVECVSPADREKYGPCMVFLVIRGYYEMTSGYPWPKNNRPLLIEAYSEKIKEMVCSTPGFFRKEIEVTA